MRSTLLFKILRQSAALCLVYFFSLGGASGQSSKFSNGHNTDTVHILNGRVEVLMRAGAFRSLKAEKLFRMHSILFGKNDVFNTEGFAMGERDTLSFYQTSIDKPTINDGGLTTWTIIQSFTDKIPDNQWIESGWNKLGDDYLYFVKLVSIKKPERFFKFDFFFIDNKLAFSLFQHPIIDRNLSGSENYAIVSARKEHPSRLIRK